MKLTQIILLIALVNLVLVSSIEIQRRKRKHRAIPVRLNADGTVEAAGYQTSYNSWKTEGDKVQAAVQAFLPTLTNGVC